VKEFQHAGPWFLPDGRHLVFLALASGQTAGTIWAISLDDPSHRTRVVESAGSAAYAGGWLFYTTTAGGRRLVAQPFDADRLALRGSPQPVRDGLPGSNSSGYAGFAVSATGTLVVDRPRPIIEQLTWMDRTGTPVGTVGPRGFVPDFALSPDERQIVAVVQNRGAAQRALWLFDDTHEQGTQLTYQEPGTRPIWARDNRHIYFNQGPLARSIAIGAAASSPFDHPAPFVLFEDMTRDSKYIVFRSLNQEIWIQAAGSDERRALVQGPYPAFYPRVSPDGRWLAYSLLVPSGQEVFVQPFDRPGERTDIGTGIGPIWREDSRELYYESADGVLMSVGIADRGNAVEPGAAKKLFAVHTQGFVPNQPHNVEVAAHGQKFLVNAVVAESDNQPLEVTTNWTVDLKK
jgi:Tol biopolymer transport system component